MYRISETDRAWLAGVIDGEGCFTLSIAYSDKYRLRVTPWFSIGMNDDGTWIHRISHLLNTMGIPHQVKDKKHNSVKEVVVTGSSNVRAVCDCILPYSVVKRELVEKMIHYKGMSSRNQYNRDDPVRRVEAQEVADFIDFIRVFNRKRNVPYKWTGALFMQHMGYGS